MSEIDFEKLKQQWRSDAEKDKANEIQKIVESDDFILMFNRFFEGHPKYQKKVKNEDNRKKIQYRFACILQFYRNELNKLNEISFLQPKAIEILSNLDGELSEYRVGRSTALSLDYPYVEFYHYCANELVNEFEERCTTSKTLAKTEIIEKPKEKEFVPNGNLISSAHYDDVYMERKRLMEQLYRIEGFLEEIKNKEDYEEIEQLIGSQLKSISIAVEYCLHREDAEKRMAERKRNTQ